MARRKFSSRRKVERVSFQFFQSVTSAGQAQDLYTAEDGDTLLRMIIRLGSVQLTAAAATRFTALIHLQPTGNSVAATPAPGVSGALTGPFHALWNEHWGSYLQGQVVELAEADVKVKRKMRENEN